MIELLLEFYIKQKLNTDNVTVSVSFHTKLKTLLIRLTDDKLSPSETAYIELVYSLENSEGLARLDFLIEKALHKLMVKRYYRC